MSAWTVAATVLVVTLLPLAGVIWRAPTIDAAVAYQLAGVIVTLVMLLLCEAYGDTSFADLAVVLAMLGLGSGLVFVRFLERWV
jgi:multisubunit Na+/H+ antiporter MnhF subunit